MTSLQGGERLMSPDKTIPSHIGYLCIEGVIGAGKTTLTRKIAERFSGRAVYEDAEYNPFLSAFYKNRTSVAFQAQLWFLMSRYRQLTETLPRQDLFTNFTVADYMFAKDAIFAGVNLDENELSMYHNIADMLGTCMPKPDFVIYLQASTSTLIKRIEKRGRDYETDMDRSYIETLNEAYNHFFFHYTESPLLIINTDNLDFVANESDFDDIIDQLNLTKWGSAYYSPPILGDGAVIRGKRKKDEDGQ